MTGTKPLTFLAKGAAPRMDLERLIASRWNGLIEETRDGIRLSSTLFPEEALR